MHTSDTARDKPVALALLASERPRNVGWLKAGGILFGDWGTSRLYVLGLAMFFAGRTSFWLICMMSLLILAVGWAYTQICRIYPDGGGVYTAAKHKSRMLAVIGALLLFADYTVTCSLSVLDAFHYFGLPVAAHEHLVETESRPHFTHPIGYATDKYDPTPGIDAGDNLDAHRSSPASEKEKLFQFDSPALWAIVAIAGIGLFNLMGPKHTGGFAVAAAVGMVFITLLITIFAIAHLSGFHPLPNATWADLPHRIGHLHHNPTELWIAFVSIVLALSGVEAIANLTGVMERPVPKTANKAIFVVAFEVAIFNILLAAFMVALPVVNRDAHLEDMAAFLSQMYVGSWGEWAVRIVGGLLLISAGNTAITDMISVQYLMARDGELPQFMAKLNRFGVPWMPAIVAGSVPIIVLLISHDLDRLAALYAIGVIGAVSINVSLCSIHPRLRKAWRKIAMMVLGLILLFIWVTLAFVKHEALIFVSIVMAVGLTARELNRWFERRKGPKPSLLQQAILSQLPADAMTRPKLLVGTYGSDALARSALHHAKDAGATLVVCFIRQVNLSYKFESEQNLTVDTDQAALRAFRKFLDLGHDMNVPVLPVYDTGPDAAVLMAENAAIYGCERVLIGTSRQGAIYHLIKGHFQHHLEALLPPEIPVEVITPESKTASIDTEVSSL